MKLTEYLKDRGMTYLMFGVTWVLVLIFLYAFHVQFEAVVIVSVLLLLGVAAAELWSFRRKKRYYDKLMSDLEQLDQKYLLSEMTEEPDFCEGRLLYTVMQETNKSMCEHIGDYRRENAAFREYIELWVHEIKLPVAGMQLMCHNDGNTKYAEQLRRIDDYIENVLYYARSRNAEKDYIIKAVSLKRVFSETAIRNRTELQERDIALHTEGLDTEVMTDAKWLAFILGQLMNNSMKYDATEISVRAEDTPE
ncbi:MAG: HAMP domain-containing histidine kinase, partial [Oscillospiraceae bacterium]|nr:HAMP domain-containing histidine kinase [Oscillospiraceae bacterium]